MRANACVLMPGLESQLCAINLRRFKRKKKSEKLKVYEFMTLAKSLFESYSPQIYWWDHQRCATFAADLCSCFMPED